MHPVFKIQEPYSEPAKKNITDMSTSNLNIEDQPLEVQWEHLLQTLEDLLGKRPADLNGVLFLIGVQEL